MPNRMIPVIPKCVLMKAVQLTSETHHPLPARPGQPVRYDYEYLMPIFGRFYISHVGRVSRSHHRAYA
jgi:hypothetical protein